MNIKPLQDRVLVSRREGAKQTEGGLYIPENAKEKPAEGVVIAVGPGTYLKDGSIRPLDVKPNDRVLFNKFGGNEINIEGEERIILRQEEILAILEV